MYIKLYIYSILMENPNTCLCAPKLWATVK